LKYRASVLECASPLALWHSQLRLVRTAGWVAPRSVNNPKAAEDCRTPRRFARFSSGSCLRVSCLRPLEGETNQQAK
jgi:hypothetical protein